MTDTVRHAEAGTAGWREAARAIQSERLDHDVMYQLGAQLSETLRAIETVARVLAGQVEAYPEGRRLRDDEGDGPLLRLAEAGAALAWVRQGLSEADRAVQRYWSAIGHIGLADTTNTEG